jgi:hypothetical protein
MPRSERRRSCSGSGWQSGSNARKLRTEVGDDFVDLGRYTPRSRPERWHKHRLAERYFGWCWSERSGAGVAIAQQPWDRRLQAPVPQTGALAVVQRSHFGLGSEPRCNRNPWLDRSRNGRPARTNSGSLRLVAIVLALRLSCCARARSMVAKNAGPLTSC